MKEYDFLIVGSGLFGAVFAYEAKKSGKKCLVIDKRDHTGGNTYCKEMDGINVHYYGPHIFHTNDKFIWDYVNSFVEFNRFTYSPVASYKNRLYNLPFNMNTFYSLWGVTTPGQAKEKIRSQVEALNITEPQNLEEQALALVGTDIYETLIKGYTEKQWGRKASELPAFIIKRLPVRFTFDNNYFNDRYQGIPIGGYNKLTNGLLEGTEVRLNTNFLSDVEHFKNIAHTIIYTGAIDEYFGFRFGALEYRSLRFDHQKLDIFNFQGNAATNFTEAKVPYTRIIEHKHFEFGTQPNTVITYEFPMAWEKGQEPFYPVNDEANSRLFKKYQALAKDEDQVIFGGRLAEYRYYDMHQVIGSSLKAARRALKLNES